MKKILFALILIMLLSACIPISKKIEEEKSEVFEVEESTAEIDIENEEKPSELTVYMVGDKVHIVNEETTYYITNYTLGPYGPLTNGAREYGHMFYGYMEEFEEETGIKLNIQIFPGMETMEDQIMKDIAEGKKGPDVIIADFSGWSTANKHNNIHRLINNALFIDMMPCLEQEAVYESDEYFNTVLNAGTIDGKQYVLPLCFNMNAIFSSTEDMSRLGVCIEDGMESTLLLEQLTQACLLAEEDELVLDNLSMWSAPTTFVQSYWESTGCPIVNYETGEVTVNREAFEDIALCFKEYLKMNVVEDWDVVLEDAKRYLNATTWSGYSIPGHLETLDRKFEWFGAIEEYGVEWINQGVFFYENSIATSTMHSLAGQCVTLNSIYNDLDETMVMAAIPMYEENDQYMAQVRMYGGVTTESEYPYHGYQLLKYLMDQEYDPYYVIPMKKMNAEKMLEELEKTVYTLHLSRGNSWDYNEDFTNTLETYDVQPLPDNLKQQLQHMLDNIGGASLPEASVYVPLVWHMEAYAFELETMDEAYENACADLEKHMEYIMAGDSEMDFSSMGYKASFLK